MIKININVKPNSKNPKIEKTGDDQFKVHVTSPPKDGRANQELISMMADYFDCHKNQVSIISGWKSRNKILQIKT